MPDARTILAAVYARGGAMVGRGVEGEDLGPVSIFDFISELTSEMRRLVVVVVINLIIMHVRYSPVIRVVVVVVIVQCCHASHVP